VSGFLTGQLRAANCTDPGEALLELDHLAARHEQDKAHCVEASGRCARMDAEERLVVPVQQLCSMLYSSEEGRVIVTRMRSGDLV